MRNKLINFSVLTFVFLLGISVLSPFAANADITTQGQKLDDSTIALLISAMQNETRPYGRLPQSPDAKPRRIFTIPVTAYTSEVGQTDSTPCITASGLDVCVRNTEDIVAA